MKILASFQAILLGAMLLLSPNASAAQGDLDSTWGGTGRVITGFPASTDDGASSVVLQSDGKILIGGVSNGNFALVRYNVGGTLDTCFNGTGRVTTNFGSSEAIMRLEVSLR